MMIRAPFTPDQVLQLNKHQTAGEFYPFTCTQRSDGAHGDGEGALVATVNGWICPFCDYRQYWAHEFMAAPPAPAPVATPTIAAPILTPKDLFERFLNAAELGAEPNGQVPAPTAFTCFTCGAAARCPWAFDLYNTGGDCLAEK